MIRRDLIQKPSDETDSTIIDPNDDRRHLEPDIQNGRAVFGVTLTLGKPTRSRGESDLVLTITQKHTPQGWVFLVESSANPGRRTSFGSMADMVATPIEGQLGTVLKHLES